jgi:glycosyltransferase involved in cell wall biosynthesis
MKIVWITRSFLDYRIPVFEEMARLNGVEFSLCYCKEAVPNRVDSKILSVLSRNHQGFSGEWRFPYPSMADVPEKYGFKRIPRLFVQPKLIKKVLRFQPDVVVTDGFAKWTYAALYLRIIKRIPHVMCYERTAHTERNAQWYRVAYRKFVMRWIDAICCCGSLCGDYVKSLDYPEEKLAFGHMVADTAGFDENIEKVTDNEVEALKKELGTNGTVFLFTGQLIPRKGISELLGAWKGFVSKSTEQSTLVLVGDGPQRQELESYATENGLDNVKFVGKIDYDSIAPYYKLADVFVIPTLEDNWSLVVPEAMASGLPVMCSKYNGCHPELVTPANGWVFDPLDGVGTTSALLAVVNSKDKFANMGQVSRSIIKNDHTPKHAANAVYEACKIATNEFRGK